MFLSCFHYTFPSGVPISKLNQKTATLDIWLDFLDAPLQDIRVHSVEAHKNGAYEYRPVHVPRLIQFPESNIRALHGRLLRRPRRCCDRLSPPSLHRISSNLMDLITQTSVKVYQFKY